MIHLVTTNSDSSVAHLSGTGQRELYYVYDTNGNNALGQLTKQYQDTGWNTAKTAATLYEYDTFGNVVKQTLALASSPTPQNSPITEMAYGAEELTDGIYRTVSRTRYNAAENSLVSVQKSLSSNLSDVLESKNLTIDERNLTSTQWVEYHNGTKRKTYNALPTSDITAEAVSVDGFTLSQTDNVGVTTTAGRTLTVTDARGNTSWYRYDVRGYLQIACCGLTRSAHPALWLITWDPTQPIATRPLAIQKDGTWYSAPARLASQDSRSQVCSRLGVWLLKSHPAYGWDLTKNICELYGSNGYIRTAYTYTPYGEVTESANGVYQPIQWSSEFNDAELGMVYYNYRHYNQTDGKWVTRDPVPIKTNARQYTYVNNSSIMSFDVRGLYLSLSNYSISSCEFSHLKKCPEGARKRQKGAYEVDIPGYHCSGKQYEYRTNTPKKNYTPSVNGCGGNGSTKFPEEFWLFNIKSACDNHDRCYGTCGKNRIKCDHELLNDIFTICLNEGGLFLFSACLFIASLYSDAVLIAGNEFYEEGQDEGCEWQPCVE